MPQLTIIAAGIEIRDQVDAALFPFVNSKFDPGNTPSTWTFPKGVAASRVTHEVRLVYTQAEFAAALDMPDAYVAYEGHSRYGQGPAFGPSGIGHVPDKRSFPVNPWGVHFRMGYDATDTECVEDLLEHSVDPAQYDLPAAGPKAFLGGALKKAAARALEVQEAVNARRIKPGKLCGVRGAWRLLRTCDPAIAVTVTARGDAPLKARGYYAHKLKPIEYLTAVKVGAADLAAVRLRCKVLLMSSCSSRVHFLRALDRRRKATKSGCKFYMTGNTCSATLSVAFLSEILNGHDPTTKAGISVFKRAMNGMWDSGVVGVY